MNKVSTSVKKTIQVLRDNSFFVAAFMITAVVASLIVTSGRTTPEEAVASTPTPKKQQTQQTTGVVAGESTAVPAAETPAPAAPKPTPTPSLPAIVTAKPGGAPVVPVMPSPIVPEPEPTTPTVPDPPPTTPTTPTTPATPTTPTSPVPGLTGPVEVMIAPNTLSPVLTLKTDDGSTATWQAQDAVLLPDGSYTGIAPATLHAFLSLASTTAAVTGPSVSFQIRTALTAVPGQSYWLYISYNGTTPYPIKVTITSDPAGVDTLPLLTGVFTPQK